MIETAASLQRLIVNHAQLLSGCSAQAKVLASDNDPKLLQQATAQLERNMRNQAKGLDPAEKTALVDFLAGEYPELDFSGTRAKLLGL